MFLYTNEPLGNFTRPRGLKWSTSSDTHQVTYTQMKFFIFLFKKLYMIIYTFRQK